MGITFNQVPSNDRVPFVAVEFSAMNAQQGPALLAYQGILIGQKLAAGTAAADSVVPVTSVEDAIAKAGRGSMLHRMAIAWFASNKSTPLFMGVLADDAGGVAATGTITVTGPATADGTIALYLGGDRITVGVASGDDATAIGDAIVAAITAAADLPVTAANVAGVVTVTYRHKGLVGNVFDMRDSFNDGEALPAGVALAYVAMGTATAGTTNPSLTNLIAAMAALWFQIWAHPYTDATSLTAIETELASRFGPTRQQDGLAITSTSGVYSTLTTLGTGRNSPSSTIIAQPGAVPLTPPPEFAAEVAALVAAAGQADPARPFQTLAMSHAIAPPESDQFTFDERNTFLYDGIATTRRGPGGVVQLERVITTYQKNGAGAADTAYLDATTVLTLLYLRWSFRTRMQTKYPRHKLADDSPSKQYGSGQAIMTPSLGKAEAVTWFEDMMDLGLVEDLAQFKRDLLVLRNAGDPSRLDFLLPPNLINGLDVVAAQVQFIL